MSTQAIHAELRPKSYGDLYWTGPPPAPRASQTDTACRSRSQAHSYRANTRSSERSDEDILRDPTYREMAQSLGDGGGATAEGVAQRLLMPRRAVEATLETLVERGVLLRTSDWKPFYRLDPSYGPALTKAVQQSPPVTTGSPRSTHKGQWDAFISYASEDREAVARPLARSLRRRGLRIWYDEFELAVGDSLVQVISDGMAHSRCGILVISPAFIAKRGFTQWELNGLVKKHINGDGTLLPVLHEIEPVTIRRMFPALGDIFSLRASLGTRAVAGALVQRIRRQE